MRVKVKLKSRNPGHLPLLLASRLSILRCFPLPSHPHSRFSLRCSLIFRFALRTLAKSPGFAAVAIATLAIAIGVNSAIFSLVNGVMLRPLVPDKPEEVVNLFTARKEANRDYRQFSLRRIRRAARSRTPSSAMSPR